MTPYTVAAYIYLVQSRFLNIWWRLRSKQQWYRVDSQCFNLLSLEYLSVSNSMTISRVSGALGYKITVLWHSSKSYFRNCSDCSNQWPSSEKNKIVQNLISSSDAAMFCLVFIILLKYVQYWPTNRYKTYTTKKCFRQLRQRWTYKPLHF